MITARRFFRRFDPHSQRERRGLHYAIEFIGNDVFVTLTSSRGDFLLGEFNVIADGRNLINAGTVIVPTKLLETNTDLQVIVHIFDKDGGFTDYFVKVPHNTPQVLAPNPPDPVGAVFGQSTHASDEATDRALASCPRAPQGRWRSRPDRSQLAVAFSGDEFGDSKSSGQNVIPQRLQLGTHIVTPTGLMIELDANYRTGQIDNMLRIPSTLQAGDDSVNIFVEILESANEPTSAIALAGLNVEVEVDQTTNADVATVPGAKAPDATGAGAALMNWILALVLAIVLILGALGWFFRRAIVVVVVESAKASPPSANGSNGSSGQEAAAQAAAARCKAATTAKPSTIRSQALLPIPQRDNLIQIRRRTPDERAHAKQFRSHLRMGCGGKTTHYPVQRHQPPAFSAGDQTAWLHGQLRAGLAAGRPEVGDPAVRLRRLRASPGDRSRRHGGRLQGPAEVARARRRPQDDLAAHGLDRRRRRAAFYQEAAPRANLEHPNIVPIYEIKEVQGRHYVRWRSSRGALSNARRRPRADSHKEILDLYIPIVDAVAFCP